MNLWLIPIIQMIMTNIKRKMKNMTITNNYLTPNQYSRPCTKRTRTTKVAVHYVGNPNTSALANRNYFENCKDTHKYVSSNYIVGLIGEVICCVPDEEIAYCTNQANSYSVSIEVCHPKKDGVFADCTYVSLCELCAMLLKKYKLAVDDLIRHADVTGKQCPLCWVKTKYQSEAVATARWNRFKQDVQTVMNGGKVTRNNTVDITESSIKGNIAKPIGNPFTNTTTSTLPYKVKVIDTDKAGLNVRSGAGVNNPVVTTIKYGEVYTVVDEVKVGSSTWGLLKAYKEKRNGWINLSNHYVEKIK